MYIRKTLSVALNTTCLGYVFLQGKSEKFHLQESYRMPLILGAAEESEPDSEPDEDHISQLPTFSSN